jgi:hypothetical protein
MKKSIFVLLIALLSIYSFAQTVRVGISNIESTLIISARPNSAIVGNYSGGVVTIRWSTSYTGVVLSNPATTYGSWDQRIDGTSGGYKYTIFNWAGATIPINWQPNTNYELFRVVVSGGTGTGTFDLAPNGWITDPNGNWYFEVGGSDLTDYSNTFFQQTVNNVPLPVELSKFSLSAQKNSILINWETKTEVNSSIFQIERALYDNRIFVKVGEVTASGNSNSPKNYTFEDKKLQSGKYIYRLKMIDNDGTYEYSKEVVSEIELPKEFAVSQNYPNPFNPTTRISYQLPFDSRVTMELYGIGGEKVATIVNGEMSTGYYTADINASELNLASGVYIFRMTAQNPNAQNFVKVIKLMLTK